LQSRFGIVIYRSASPLWRSRYSAVLTDKIMCVNLHVKAAL